MAKAAAISFKEFRSWYHTEKVCREELFRQQLPEGFVYPKCGCKKFYSIRSRSICQCRSCRHQTSVTAGTIIHRIHLPLTIWFWAVWHLLERIRKAMEQRDEHYQLSGIVEMDDYYVGVSSHNGKHGRGTDKNQGGRGDFQDRGRDSPVSPDEGRGRLQRKNLTSDRGPVFRRENQSRMRWISQLPQPGKCHA